jgi:hypothetical protein
VTGGVTHFFGGRSVIVSVIEGVDDSTSTTLSDLSSTVLGVGRRPIRELVDDRLLDELLARSRDEAGGLRLTGEGALAENLIHAGQAACSYSWRIPPKRCCLRICKRAICS